MPRPSGLPPISASPRGRTKPSAQARASSISASRKPGPEPAQQFDLWADLFAATWDLDALADTAPASAPQPAPGPKPKPARRR